MDGDGLSYGNEAVVTNHQRQRLLSSLMNSLQLKEDLELFERHDTEELGVKDDHNHDHTNVKVMCLNGFYQHSFLSS